MNVTVLKNKMEKSREKALHAFIGRIGEISEKLDTLRWFADNHMEYDPEDVNWGHVGSAAHVAEQLDEIINFLGITK